MASKKASASDTMDLKETVYIILAVFAVMFLFALVGGGYNDVDLSQIVPLLQNSIAYLIFIGTPIFLALIALILVKTTRTGARLVKNLFRRSHTERTNHSAR